MPRQTIMADPIDVFISYAPKDEAQREELAVHLAVLLRSGEIRAFDASKMRPGAVVQAEVDDRITRARLILLLVSADFLASNACDAEVAQALERHGTGEAIVFPVILRNCDWRGASFAKLMPLPRKSEAIASAKDRDEAWAEVVEAVRAAIALLKIRPVPSYQDAATQALCDRVEEARERKRRLLEVGVDTSEIDREIRDLRRQLREGGQLRAGDALGNGRYLLLRQVGRGGFAIVWEAHDRERDERVAVKVLHSNLAGDRIRLERFFRGARTMAELEHEHVVRVREQRGEDGGYHYFVMEFI